MPQGIFYIVSEWLNTQNSQTMQRTGIVKISV